MRNISVYLAGPIDGVSVDVARAWREAAEDDLPSGVLLFSPAHAYLGANRANARELHYLNTRAIEGCDAVIANLGNGMTLGTCREIERARLYDKPVAVMLPADRRESLMLYDLHVAETFEEALMLVMEDLQKRRNQPRVMDTPFGRFYSGEVHDAEDDDE